MPGIPVVMREPFAGRVHALRDSWAERRQIARYAGSHDYASQLLLLLTLHEWTLEAASDIQSVYDGAIDVGLSPRPEAGDQPPGFTLTIGDGHAVTFTLMERRRASGTRWHVSVSLRSPGSAGIDHAGPERRNGQWSRARLEDVLLSVLGGFERANSSGSDADFDAPAALG